MEAIAEEVLEFWFGDDLDSPRAIAGRGALWFGSDPKFDEEIRRRFGSLPERAAESEFDAWTNQPRSALALVLSLDQFPRNLFRGSAQAFLYDTRACSIALASIESGFDQMLHPIETLFLYLPLEHAENLDPQNRCVALMEKLASRAPTQLSQAFAGFSDYARRHRDIIQRFGRFPYRNKALGRTSSPEEVAYLAAGGETFAGPNAR